MSDNPSETLQVVWRGGSRFDIRTRHHTVRVDQPPDFCGTDTGPTPCELLVGSLAACAAHAAERYLHRCELLADVTVTARYETGVQPARVSRIALTVEAPGLPEGLRESFTRVIEHCAVYNSLRIPPEITFQVLVVDHDHALHGV
ncbi:OsmC family protein [Planomonospora corallina]|uniref:OsmC family protein n=1 Tax=Planomonospora corallina TaxID=1806052 RepID=A0ABV8IBP3_9ACTN